MKSLITFTTLLSTAALSRGMDAEIEYFEKKVRPLLVTHCVGCHGPQKQKGDLRLDSREAALKGGDNGPAFVAGKPEKSLINIAVGYQGEVKMPPKGKLADEEIAILNQWVKTGAAWPAGGAAPASATKPFDLKERLSHWSFQPVRKPAVPKADPAIARNPVDAFILEKLSQKGLKLAAAADKRTLLRRVTLDLTGLPPTPAEIDSFLKDESANAFEKVVDRLLASPAYGERYGRHWLDLARYAETLGHEFDFELHEPWRYRDYVIRAFNEDVPYDQFVREQVAGDQLAKPRRHPTDDSNESVQGTAFWFLGEAKHAPVDIRVDQADRLDNEIDVFAKTFLGLTVSCARCHDHKFDPISTKDYYALFGIVSSSRHDKAFIDSPERRAKWLEPMSRTARELEDLAIARTAGKLQQQLAAKGIAGLPGGSPAWAELVALAGLAPEQYKAKASELLKKQTAQEQALAVWSKQTKALPLPRTGWTIEGEAFSTNSQRATVGDDGRVSAIPSPAIASNSLSSKLTGSLRSATFVIDRDFLLYRTPGTGVTVNLIVDNFQMIMDPIYGALRFGANGDESRWHAQNVARWKGHRAYVEVLDDGNGKASVLDVIQVDQPSQPPVPAAKAVSESLAAATPEAFGRELSGRIVAAIGRWKSGTPLSEDEGRLLNLVLGSTANVAEWTEAEKSLRTRFQALEQELPPARRAMAIAEGTGLNERVFIRGNHKTPGEEVPRRFLEGIDASPFTQGTGRAELAAKLTDPKNPLTARVYVNRVWKHHFGEGIVRTPDDFGYQGQRPTHPELLDWLAGWFVENGWSSKKLHRLIVLSAAYQQGSTADAKSDEGDPKNELLHKMPVRRMEAEVIRDTLLAVSGRLDPTMGGPPVPTYLTAFMIGRGRPGGSGPLDGAGRRSIYQQVRRNFLNPFFAAFDYPVPFTAIGRRSSSNVPAQALAMLNNPFVNQQTEIWAKRVLAEKTGTTDDRINQMYVMAFGRPASAEELREGREFVQAQLAEYGAGQQEKAWADFAHVLVNLKEFIFIR